MQSFSYYPFFGADHLSDLSTTAREGAPCVFGGNVYRSGESFQSSCKYQCTCLDGAVGCVPLCGMDVRLPSPDCPMPRRVKVPGKCCEEWVCDSPPTTNSFMGSFLPGEERDPFSDSQIYQCKLMQHLSSLYYGVLMMSPVLIESLHLFGCSLQRRGNLWPRSFHHA